MDNLPNGQLRHIFIEILRFLRDEYDIDRDRGVPVGEIAISTRFGGTKIEGALLDLETMELVEITDHKRDNFKQTLNAARYIPAKTGGLGDFLVNIIDETDLEILTLLNQSYGHGSYEYIPVSRITDELTIESNELKQHILLLETIPHFVQVTVKSGEKNVRLTSDGAFFVR
ncbi:MAG: hypothetical protein GY771_11115 [bacterium]|nr:hypothetical protein [bacterium]